MLITIRTSVTFNIPKEKALMEEFERDNPDWVCVPTAHSATYKRTQMFEIGAERREP